MEAIYILIPIALILVIIALVFFFWAVKNDQFDDLEGPGHSILFDDDLDPPAAKKPGRKQQKENRANHGND